MLTFDPDATPDQNYMRMSDAFARVSTGLITFAARDSDFDGNKIKKGEILALEGGRLMLVEKDVVRAAVRLVRAQIRKHADCSFVTIIYGADATAEQAQQIESAVRTKYGDLEIAVINGGQRCITS
jgi:dihydroxyacetone kinase-like predicted kinase